MQRPFWPTTAMGKWAFSIGSVLVLCLLVFAVVPTSLQFLFGIGSYDALLTGSVTFLGLCLVSAGLALGALVRMRDRGWGVYLALIPSLYLLISLLGSVNE